LNLDVADERSLVGLEILSIIHEMLQNLVNYDFGYVFSEPVNIAEVPGYKEIVERPMDFSTICSKLINGDFTKLLDDNFSMDDLVTSVLNDIELIWRNCIMFNVIGSSVARMAVVLRRRVKMICKRSLFDKLSSKMKKDLEDYARKFDNDWASALSGSLSKGHGNSGSSDSWIANAVRNHKPRSKAKIKSAVVRGSNRVAVLDSVGGRVINLYTSAKAASKAVETLLNLGHRCEWNVDAKKNCFNQKLILQILQKSRDDPNALLFGYRWLLLDDLNEGRVTFAKSVCDIIEMQLNQFTFVFRSIEEALSSSQLPATLDIDELRNKLMDLDRNDDWTEIDEMKWRRPILPDGHLNNSTRSVEPQLAFGNNPETLAERLPSWRNCAIFKKDLFTDENLVGFDSIELAHQDWVQTAFSSPSFPKNEARTIDNFAEFYLDGDRNVDGMVWQSVDNRNSVEIEEEKEARTIASIAHPMDIQGQGDMRNDMSDSTDKPNSASPSRTEESVTRSSVDDSYTTIAVTVDDQQQSLEESNISRKRKCLEDDEIDFPAEKEARFAVVTVSDR